MANIVKIIRHCLKGSNCDFSHNIGPQQYLRFHQQQDRSSPFHKRTLHPYQILPPMKYPFYHPPQVLSAHTAPNEDSRMVPPTPTVPQQQLPPLPSIVCRDPSLNLVPMNNNYESYNIPVRITLRNNTLRGNAGAKTMNHNNI